MAVAIPLDHHPRQRSYVVYTHNWQDDPLRDRFDTLDKRLASKIPLHVSLLIIDDRCNRSRPHRRPVSRRASDSRRGKTLAAARRLTPRERTRSPTEFGKTQLWTAAAAFCASPIATLIVGRLCHEPSMRSEDMSAVAALARIAVDRRARLRPPAQSRVVKNKTGPGTPARTAKREIRTKRGFR